MKIQHKDGYDRVLIQAAEESFGMQVGEVWVRVHAPEQCAGTFCCVHNPSDHPLKGDPLNWRGDRGLMERICQHGVGHPDPDDLAFKKRTMTSKDYRSHAYGVHGCDGCCTGEHFA